MTHYYEKNIVEIKHEYTECLLDITTPFIYEGIKEMYDYSYESHKQLLQKEKEIDSDRKVKNTFEIFQLCLADTENYSSSKMEHEVNRIKSKSKSNCADWYDDLVKAVIKSNIVLLTYTTSQNKSQLVERRFHESVRTSDFIHKCYVSCANTFYNYPEIFYHGYHSLKIKENQRIICNIIEKGIRNAIRKMLPMKLILLEYNTNDYLTENDSNTKYDNIRNKLYQDVNHMSYGNVKDKDNKPSILESGITEETGNTEKSFDDNYKEVDDNDIVDEIIHSDDDSANNIDSSSILNKIKSIDNKMNVENDNNNKIPEAKNDSALMSALRKNNLINDSPVQKYNSRITRQNKDFVRKVTSI